MKIPGGMAFEDEYDGPDSWLCGLMTRRELTTLCCSYSDTSYKGVIGKTRIPLPHLGRHVHLKAPAPGQVGVGCAYVSVRGSGRLASELGKVDTITIALIHLSPRSSLLDCFSAG